MGSVVMGGGLMDLLIRPMKCPGRPCLIGGGGYLNRYPTLSAILLADLNPKFRTKGPGKEIESGYCLILQFTQIPTLNFWTT